MENKLQPLQIPTQTDVHLRDILNGPLKSTPAVPTPDWSTSAPPTPIPMSQVRTW